MQSAEQKDFITGMRAVAVLAVLAFHLEVSAVGGGFVGVDVFFVISGYLICNIIFRDAGTRGFITAFYERRARRILPAFFVVSAATSVAAWFLLMPKELASYARSLLFSVFAMGNVHFYQTLDYFAPDAKTMPLLHYWTLGVEEQFYFAFPIIVLAIKRFAPRFLAPIVFALVAISLVASAIWYQINSTAAFYLPWFRAWELLAGGAVLLAPVPRGRAIRELFAAIGVLMILAAIFLYDEAMQGPWMILPVAGAAMILWAHGSNAPTVTGKILSLPPMVLVGDISYSIYLLHWPLAVFADRLFPDALLARQVAVSALAIGLAYPLWRFVENPFRQNRRIWTRARVFALSGAAISISTLVCFFAIHTQGFPQRLPADVQKMLAWETFDTDTINRYRTCFQADGQSPDRLVDLGCFGPGPHPIALWGDSHAASYYPGLKTLMPGATLWQANASGCPPIVGFKDHRRPGCEAFNNFVVKQLIERKPETVLLAANWSRYQAASKAVAETVAMLEANQIKAVVVGQSPIFRRPPPELLAGRMLRNDQNTLSGDDLSPAVFALDQTLSKALGPKYVSLLNIICPGRSCPLVVDGEPTHWDNGHLTMAGSLLYSRPIADAIKPH